MKPLKEKISITIDSDLLEALRAEAEKDDRSLSQYINLILKERANPKIGKTIKKAAQNEPLFLFRDSKQSAYFAVFVNIYVFSRRNFRKSRHCHYISRQSHDKSRSCGYFHVLYRNREMLRRTKLFRVIGKAILCFAIHTGKLPKPSVSSFFICFSAFGEMLIPSPP